MDENLLTTYKNIPKKLLYITLGKAIVLILLLNGLNLIVEIYKLEMGDNILVGYIAGYITLNENQIGFNIFTNILGLLIVFILALYCVPEIKKQ